MVYKFDRNDNSGTPEGSAIVGFNSSVPTLGGLLGVLYASNNVQFARDAQAAGCSQSTLSRCRASSARPATA